MAKKLNYDELAAEVLLEGVEILDAGGWCRRSYRNSKGQHCMEGAMHDTTTYLRRGQTRRPQAQRDEIKRRIWAAIRAVTGGYHPIYFNDHIARSKRDAQRAMTKAAKLLQNGEVK